MTPLKPDSDLKEQPSPAEPANGSGDWFRVGSSSDTFGQRRPKPVDRSNWPLLPDFEILGESRCGGLAVFKARQLSSSDQVVALKMLLPADEMDAESRARFAAEAKLIAHLSHVNIAGIYRFGEHGGRLYFAQEFLDAGSLRRWFTRTPPSPHQAAAVIEPVARAIQHVHERGFVHGALTPSIILLSSRVGGPRNGGIEPDHSAEAPQDPVAAILPVIPKIADFGLAQALFVRESRGRCSGAPYYLAPEQGLADPSAIGPAADLYALGAILYHIITGRPPFDGASTEETLFLLRYHEPIPPRWFRPSIPKDLETICLNCLEKHPPRRYPRASDLADDLQRFLNDLPIQARAPHLFERCRRWFRRSRKWAK